MAGFSHVTSGHVNQLVSNTQCHSITAKTIPSYRKCNTLVLKRHSRVNARDFIPVTRAAQLSVVESRSTSAEQDILDAVSGVKGRGVSGIGPDEQDRLERAVEQLEKSGQGVKDPTKSKLLTGRWRLLYTTRPSSASPIQRSFTGVDGFSVFQEVLSGTSGVRVNNIVDFGKAVGFLKVEAAGSTDAQPLPDFEPRKGKGLPFGILGTSSVEPPSKVHTRIDFQFDTAAFYFKSLPLTIPYPVPFRLLGDERKGWLDVTYLSKDGQFRLSRGNKGTLFVLVKDNGPQERLLESVSSSRSDSSIEACIDDVLDSGAGIPRPAYSPACRGGWRLIWTKQGETANPLQQRLVNVVKNWQILSADGTALQNRVDLFPGISIIAEASAEPASATRTRVVISRVLFKFGFLTFTLPIETDADGYVDWLYLDNTIRITKGNKGSVFVHVRDTSVQDTSS